jgi:hypothetical protein
LNDIEFHQKQIHLVGKIISGIEAHREWCDLICSGVDPGSYDLDAILDHRRYYQESIEYYQKLFFESQQAFEAAGLDWIDYVETPEKALQEQLAQEKRIGIHRLTRWQFFWKRLFSTQWKRID